MLRRLKPLDGHLDAPAAEALPHEGPQSPHGPTRQLGSVGRRARSRKGAKAKHKQLFGKRSRKCTAGQARARAVYLATPGCLAEQVNNAREQDAAALLVPAEGVGTGQTEVLSSVVTIESAPELPLPPPLSCNLATRQIAGAPKTVLTLRRVLLGCSQSDGPVLEVGAGTECELYDCHLRGGIKLCEGASAKLVRTHVKASAGAGIEGRAFDNLVLMACVIQNCAADGLTLRRGKADISDCTISDCGQSGLVLGPGEWKLTGCTMSGNAQYGVWAEADAHVTCRGNVAIDNNLGDKGGRGDLPDWHAGCGLLPGDHCRVWSESRSKWMHGHVAEVTDEVAVAIKGKSGLAPPDDAAPDAAPDAAAADDAAPDDVGNLQVDSQQSAQPDRPHGKTAAGLKVPLAGVRPRRSGGDAPPAYSKAGQRRGPYRLFMAEGGSGRQGWRQLPREVQARFHAEARRQRRQIGVAKVAKSKVAAARARAAAALKRHVVPAWLQRQRSAHRHKPG
ncbi:unnamed protein product [Effrenium voratum]|uniref:Right handed beta helix domain-containing protein n=1 Tax=Effrenium voratum TaxID=2562239 RepID=A0AA36N4Z6_9DINO|nr:unnamed protein product [Effrenium voratum]